VPRFPTPEPVAVVAELVVADVRVTASDRDDAVVEVRPVNPADPNDVKAAQQVQVECDGGRLVIRGPSRWNWRSFSPFGWNGGAVEVVVDVPTGSSLEGTVGMGSVAADGELGDCRLRTGMGDLRLEHTGEAHLRTGYGDIVVDRAAGEVEVVCGSGEVQLGRIDGPAAVRNASGVTRLGRVAGDLRVKASSGDITVVQAGGSVTATTSSGDIRIAEVVRGVVALKTSAGELSVGIRQGTAAWLDVTSQYGRVHNALDAATGPGSSEETVEVRARTAHGDIVIHRSTGLPPTKGAS
jgi:DUF4097 and DUF4098 domain-containing protein YvlB